MDERHETTPKKRVLRRKKFCRITEYRNLVVKKSSSEISSQLLLIESVHLINLLENVNVESF